MRPLIALVFLFVLFAVGCGTASKQDITAAREYVYSFYTNPDITFDITRVAGPE